MSSASNDWKVLQHGPIETLAENLWRVEGALPRMSLRRVMTVVRLKDGRILIHNAIAMNEAAMKELEGLGKPSFLIVPNGAHRLDAPAFKKRYPDIRVFAPVGSRKKVEEVIAVDGSYEDFPTDDDTVRFHKLHGINDMEGVIVVRSRDGVTVIVNDVVFNMDRKRDPLGFFFTTLLGSAPGPRVSRLAKLVMIKDKKALRSDLENLADTPALTRLIVAHEKVAFGEDAPLALRKAATYL